MSIFDAFARRFEPSKETTAPVSEKKEVVELSRDEQRKHLQELKDLSNLEAKGFFETHGVSTTEEAIVALKAQNPDTKRELLEANMFMTDVVGVAPHGETPEERMDARTFQNGADIAARMPYFMEHVRKDVDPEIAKRVEDILGDFMQFIQDKTVVTRPGFESISDLASDNILAPFLIEQRSARTLIERLDIRALAKEYGVALSMKDAAETLSELLIQLPKKESALFEKEWNVAEIELYKDVMRLSVLAETFAEENQFDRIDTSLEKLPLELQVALKEHPEFAADVNILSGSGAEVRFHSRTRTSGNVLEAIHRISVLSQHKFQANWLRDFIQKGREPVLMIGSDVEIKMNERRAQLMVLEEEIDRLETAGEKETNGEEREMIAKKLIALDHKADLIEEEIKDIEGANLEQDLETVHEGIGGYKEVVALKKDGLKPEEQEALERLNQVLSEINTDYADRRMQFDISDEQSSEAQAIVKKLMFIGPIAHGLESLHLGVFAKIFTSSADDLLGEYAEIKALLGAGFSKNDVLSRLKIAAPIFGAATYGAARVERLLEEGDAAAGGALFGVTAVALSLTTAIQSMGMYRENFRQLVAEGKISGSNFVASNPEFKKQFAEFELSLDGLSKERLIELVQQTLESLSFVLTDAEKAQILSDLNALDQKDIRKMIERNADVEAWKRAIQQDFNNPVRMGILLGSATAPLLGGTLGILAPASLSNGFVLAGVGSMESIVGGGTVMAARKIDDIKWKGLLKKRLENAGA